MILKKNKTTLSLSSIQYTCILYHNTKNIKHFPVSQT